MRNTGKVQGRGTLVTEVKIQLGKQDSHVPPTNMQIHGFARLRGAADDKGNRNSAEES